MLPGTGRSILVNIFTPSYRILGRVFIGSSGGLGLLNDPNTSSIEVAEASLARLHDPKKIADRNRMVRVVKRSVEVVVLSREFDIGPTQSARGGYGRVEKHHVRAVTHSFELEGELEWAGRFDLASVLVEGGDFIPFHGGTVRATQVPSLYMKGEALLVNRHEIDFIRKVEEEYEE